MPTFQYVAINPAGKKVKGRIEARDQKQAFQNLKERGLQALSISHKKESLLTKELSFMEQKVKPENFVIFCRQFAILIKAGIGAAEAIQILSQQTEDKVLAKTLQSVHSDLRAGMSISAAFNQYPKVFSAIVVNMVRAGEASGSLDDVLEKLAIFIEREHKTKGKIKSALAYPVTVAIISLIATFILMWKVVPQFVSTFTSLGIQLPITTRTVMAISDMVVKYWYIVLLLPMLIYVLFRSYTKTAKGRYLFDYLKLKTPVFGKLLQKSAMARFSRTFSSLFAAGVPILQTIDIVAHVVNNAVISNTLEQGKENLRRGESLGTLLKTNWVFPPMVVHMITVGEQTGSLDIVMNKVADFYEEDVEQMTDRLKSLLEPMMILILTAIIGTIVLAILQPTFSLYGNLQ